MFFFCKVQSYFKLVSVVTHTTYEQMLNGITVLLICNHNVWDKLKTDLCLVLDEKKINRNLSSSC